MAPARAALVTGGSSGIGKAMARALGEEGHALTIAARDQAKLDDTAAELRGDGFAVATVSVDLADEAAITELVAAHGRAHQRMDVCVNAAADASGGVPLAQLPTEILDRHLDVDLRAMFLTIRASLPMLS